MTQEIRTELWTARAMLSAQGWVRVGTVPGLAGVWAMRRAERE